jgi:hypothetical protein
MKYIIKYCLMLLLVSQTCVLPQSKGMGETLIYSVSWMFLRIGTITIQTAPVPEDPDYIKVSMLVESNPDLFFLWIKEYNETLIDLRNCMSKEYFGRYERSDGDLIIKVFYNEEEKFAVYTAYDEGLKSFTVHDTVFNSVRYVDGPSLFFFTRIHSGSDAVYNVPTIIDAKINNTRLVFTKDRSSVEVDAFPHPVKARKYYGYADWEGGSSQKLSGDFSGWISDDESAIPLYSEVKVLIGNLKIKLEKQYKSDLVRFIRASYPN